MDDHGREVPITGLSGITRLGGDRYAAIMDNGDSLVVFTLPTRSDGAPGVPRDVGVVRLGERHDYEDIAVCPEPLRGLIASWRMRSGHADPGPCLLVVEEDTPAIHIVALADGSLLGTIPIPVEFATRRPNRGLESIDIDADGGHLWTANEESLPGDGPPATAERGTVVRLARIAIAEPGRQAEQPASVFAYEVDPPHRCARLFAGDPLSGVSAILGIGTGRLLVLERSGCPGLPPFENRVYLVDTGTAAALTGGEGGLAGRPYEPVAKTMLWRDQLGCNLEGLCKGPRLRGTGLVVLGIADDNSLGTPNQVIGFVLEHEDPPMPVAMVAGAVVIAAVVLAFVVAGSRRIVVTRCP